MLPPPPRSTLFPYTTLFRSLEGRPDEAGRVAVVRYFLDGTATDAIPQALDRKSTRLNSSHTVISYAVFCLKKKKKTNTQNTKTRQNQQQPRLCDLHTTAAIS